jgi:hypothetical protein
VDQGGAYRRLHPNDEGGDREIDRRHVLARRRHSYPLLMARIDELKAERHRLIHSMEFAYAMGHSRTIGRDPRLEWVVQRVDELRSEIAALSAEEDG